MKNKIIIIQEGTHGDLKLLVRSQPLYDHAAFPPQNQYGQTTTSFFQNPCGRSLKYTNVITAGCLSWPKRFFVKGIRVIVGPLTTHEDAAEFYDNGFLTLRVGEVTAFSTPMALFWEREVAPFNEDADIEGAEEEEKEKCAQDRHCYMLEEGIEIPTVQNFMVTIDMPREYKPSKTVEVWVFLEGDYATEIQ